MEIKIVQEKLVEDEARKNYFFWKLFYPIVLAKN